jgi:diaminohydroxyphosphoribosylaminopyrimidine deaminase/5-amino-6-(5-phosphoribosylamino)uracil reductase
VKRAASEELPLLRALRLARRGVGKTSPNPCVGAVLVRGRRIIGEGWHRRAGWPHAEVEALADATRRGESTRGATLFVTLEPCCTHGRTPPCTAAILAAGIRRVVVATTDPNPHHAGRGLTLLRAAGVTVELAPAESRAAKEAALLNESFNHWIVTRTPFVTVKAAMTLDGKIATPTGESKWITGPAARRVGLQLRCASDAILIGIRTLLADNPSLTARDAAGRLRRPLRRIVLDSLARTPLDSTVVTDDSARLTTIVVSRAAPARRVRALAARVNVLVAPTTRGRINLRWLVAKLGAENVTRLLVEGGGEVNAAFLSAGLAHRVAFFYAPKILGGRAARPAVAGDGAKRLADLVPLHDVQWRRVGEDLLLTARVGAEPASKVAPPISPRI